MEKIKDHFKRQWREYAGVGAMCIIIGLVLIWGYKLWNLDINVPMAYAGGDEISVLMQAKMLESQNWVLSNDRLGTPYGTTFYDFTSNMMHNTETVILKIFVMITSDAAAAVNLLLLSIFFMAGLVSYYVMRQLDITYWIASLASAVFGVSPYMFMRGTGHIVLTECYFIPLSLLLCLWIFERDDVLRIDKNFFKVKKNYAAIIAIILIANNGIAYYPFFTCFMLVVTALSRFMKDKDVKCILRSVTAIAGICIFVVLSILPGVIYSITNGSNSAAVVRGGFAENELYGLKIIQLFLPANSHGIHILEAVRNEYLVNSPLINENVTSYIGITAIIGFIILMFVFFVRRDTVVKKRLAFLSEMNIMLVLLGTIGGFGTIFAFVISDKLRAYTRISIVIEYVCIVAFAVLLDSLYKKYYAQAKYKARRYVITAAGCVIMIGSAFEAFPEGYVPDYEGNYASYTSDDKFVSGIESMVEEGAMIYQLPYHKYPEGESVNNMGDYQLFVGFIHSDKLRFSYGSIKGRQGDEWNESVSKMDYPDMADELKKTGFAGIYIDRTAYVETEWKALEQELSDITGSTPYVSENGCLSFIKF